MRFTFSTIIFLCFLISAKAQDQQWKALETEADTLLAHEEYQGALKLYNRVIDTQKNRSDEGSIVLYKRAVCQYSLRQFNQALQDVNAFLSRMPDFQPANLLKAFTGRELNDPKVQAEALTSLLASDSGNAELLRWRASAFLESAKYDKARKDITILRANTADPELDLFIGISYYYEDKPDSAIFYFDKAIALDITFTTPYMYAGSVCLDQHAYELALQYLNAGVKLDPENLSMVFYKGIALVEQNKFTEGCHCLLTAFNGGIDDAGDYLKEYCYGVED